MYPGSDKLDASMALAARFGFASKDRIGATLDVIQRELGAGAYHYRYSGMSEEEGCFLACTFWQIEARALLGQRAAATQAFEQVMEALMPGVGIFPEMVDALNGEYLGNLPQGLTHLAIIQALSAMAPS